MTSLQVIASINNLEYYERLISELIYQLYQLEMLLNELANQLFLIHYY